MGKEIADHIYLKKDIDRAFNMGVETSLALFEETIGMPEERQRSILSHIRNMLIEDKAAVAMSNS